MQFSPTTGAFYDETLVYNPAIPSDAIEVSGTDFAEAIAARAAGSALSVSSGAIVITAPPAPTLAQVQATQIAALNAAYAAAIIAPISFTTAAGATATFPQTDTAKGELTSCITAGSEAWTLNLWLDVNGNPVTPFTYADLQALAAAMEGVEAPDFRNLLAKVAAVTAATTIDIVTNITF